MHGSIAPSLVEEASCAVQVVKVFLVGLTAPEVQVCDFKIAPEMAGAVAVCLVVVLGPSVLVGEPVHGVVLVEVVVMAGEELDGFWPEGCNRLGRVVEVDGEAVGLVVVLHEAEDVVVDVAEEVDVWLDAPVVLHVLQGGMLVEHARVPAAHLVVGEHVGILDVLLFQDVGRLFEQILVDPTGDFPVLFWYQLVADFGFGGCSRGPLELFGKGHIVEKGPGVVELVVPRAFQIMHGLEELGELLVSYQGEEGRIDAVRLWVVWGIIVASDSP